MSPSPPIDAELVQHRGNRRQSAAHVFGAQSAYAANAEAVGHGELARIDDVAPFLELVVEPLKHELRILEHMECDNDRRLQPFWEERREAQLLHAISEHLTVLGIAPLATGLPA